jgi:retron-type reverse transcriptase
MKEIHNIMERVTDFNHLRKSAIRAWQGTKPSEQVMSFRFHLEKELFSLQSELLENRYRPGAYHHFKVYEPKERVISVAPFRDRVVHHAIVSILEEPYEPVFIFDSYACRKGKGVHKAVKRAQVFLKKNKWFFKTDIEKFFESVCHDALLKALVLRVKDPRAMQLIEKIIRNGSRTNYGLPIGNLTSQFFANVYLHELDYFIKHRLKCKNYIRYMDDFVLFETDKEQLKKWKTDLSKFLETHLQLSLKPSATFINQRANGLRFLGARIFPATVRLHRDTINRSLNRIKFRQKQLAAGGIKEETYNQSLQSILGHWQQFDTLKMRRKVFSV